MRISGFQTCSMVDYPGKMAAVIFTPGCNMNCYYCHNRHLLSNFDKQEHYSAKHVLNEIAKRRILLDGVVISGGEPTLQKNLERFILDVRDLGYPVKLDTNGTNPEVLEDLIKHRLVDFVAMDLKAPPEKYDAICRSKVNLDAIKKSVEILKNGPVKYEFRTTMAPELTRDDLETMSLWISGATSYVLQQYRPLAAEWFGEIQDVSPEPLKPELIVDWGHSIRQNVQMLKFRGMGIETIGQKFAQGSRMVEPGTAEEEGAHTEFTVGTEEFGTA